MGVAAELAARKLEYENTHVRRLRDKLENALLQSVSEFKSERGQSKPPPEHE